MFIVYPTLTLTATTCMTTTTTIGNRRHFFILSLLHETTTETQFQKKNMEIRTVLNERMGPIVAIQFFQTVEEMKNIPSTASVWDLRSGGLMSKSKKKGDSWGTLVETKLCNMSDEYKTASPQTKFYVDIKHCYGLKQILYTTHPKASVAEIEEMYRLITISAVEIV